MMHVLLDRARPTADTLPFRLGALFRFTQPAGSGDNGGPHPMPAQGSLGTCSRTPTPFSVCCRRDVAIIWREFPQSQSQVIGAQQLPDSQSWHRADRDSGERAAACSVTGKIS